MTSSERIELLARTLDVAGVGHAYLAILQISVERYVADKREDIAKLEEVAPSFVAESEYMLARGEELLKVLTP